MAQRVRTDYTLFWTIVAMVTFGLIMVYSASSVVADMVMKNPLYFFIRQVAWAVLSFGILLWAKRKDYRRLNSARLAFGGVGITLVLLIVVYFIDSKNHRWFTLPVGHLQPSELAKPVLILFLAYFLTRRPLEEVNRFRVLAQAALIILALCGLVGLADLGTAIVLAAASFVLLFVAGLNWRYCALAAVLACVLGAAAIVAKPYRFARVVSKVDPDFLLLDSIGQGDWARKTIAKSETTRDANYQPYQSRIAIGSGGVAGLGLGNSRQKWFFLPEAHTDFIYAVIGEELGLFGCAAVLAGFMVILWRGFRLYWIAPDNFGRFLALGITVSIVIQALINMSVVLDMGPTKGIPLPMISNGGSSLACTLLCLGLLLSVSEQSG